MATAEVQIPSREKAVPGSANLSTANYPETGNISDVNAEIVVTKWIAALNEALDGQQYVDLGQLFLNESYWRDQLAFSWDYRTLRGPEQIVSFFQSGPARLKSLTIDKSSPSRQPIFSPIDFNAQVNGVSSFLTLETDVGRGRGLVRLLYDGSKWKAFTLFTAMYELRGYEEITGKRRPTGVEHGEHLGRRNWKDLRNATENFEGGLEPTVLIIGAGQGGLTLAARLQQLQLPTLIVDRIARVGDNWRNRYHQLVLHDPVWYDHLPYIPFPPTWPIFAPKDKLADWFEFYAKSLELNIWTMTTITSATWDDSQHQWTVTLSRHVPHSNTVESRVLHPRHIVQATGHSGEAFMPSIPGMSCFKGSNLCHSSQFPGAKPQPSHAQENRRAVVVGCCNSAHDIAQDYYENGYHVTMVQRSSTCVVSSKNILDISLGGLYCEDGPETADADLLFMSMPNALLKRIGIDSTKEVAKRERDLRAGLANVGFKLDDGPDDSGLFMKYLQRGGGYYIDVGCSALLASGAIALKQGQEVVEVLDNGLRFADGSELPADEIVFATGYRNMRETARKIFGEDLAERVNDVWGFDEEGEHRTIWRRSSHPGFWFFGGNLMLCRYYSRMLAVQIKALEVGIMNYGDR